MIRCVSHRSRRSEVIFDDFVAMTDLGDDPDMPIRATSSGTGGCPVCAIAAARVAQILLVGEVVGDAGSSVEGCARLRTLAERLRPRFVASGSTEIVGPVGRERMWRHRGSRNAARTVGHVAAVQPRQAPVARAAAS
jgi:ABC-type polysaccharide/polyol phosphate transport system ATPase subunit